MTESAWGKSLIRRVIPAPGAYLCGLTWDGSLFWHSDQRASRIYALARDDGAVQREYSCVGARADLAYAGGLLCQIGERPKRLLLIDPGTGELVGRKAILPSNGRVCGVEAADDGLWLCLRNPAVVQFRDFATMSVQREFPVLGNPSGLTIAGSTVYYSDNEEACVLGFDTETETLVFATPVEGRPTGITFDGEYIWYADFSGRCFRAFTPEPTGGCALDV